MLSKRLDSTVKTLKALESTLDNVQNKASSDAEKQGVLEQNLRSAEENLVLIRQRVVLREENLSNAKIYAITKPLTKGLDRQLIHAIIFTILYYVVNTVIN